MQAHKYRGFYNHVHLEVTLAGMCTYKKTHTLISWLTAGLWSDLTVVPKMPQFRLHLHPDFICRTNSFGFHCWSDGGPGIWDLDRGCKHTAWFSHQSLPLLETYNRQGVGFLPVSRTELGVWLSWGKQDDCVRYTGISQVWETKVHLHLNTCDRITADSSILEA